MTSTNVAFLNEREKTQPTRGAIWTGRILSGLAIVFLLMDASLKFVQPAPVVESFARLGYPLSTAIPLGVVLAVCTILYAMSRTAIFGVVLLTGYLGGAVATHFRVGDPLFSHVLFPVYMGAMLWGGLYLRDARLRTLIGKR